MRKLTEIIVLYAQPPVFHNGHEKIDWIIERFSLDNNAALQFEEDQKQKGLMVARLYHYDYGYELIWEDEFGHGAVVTGKQSNKFLTS